MDLSSGNALGPYVLLHRIGSGGTCDVYRARDERLRRDVAIKVLSKGGGDGALRQTRFLREARALAALSHPSVVSVFDVGETDGVAWVAMELLEGETLRARIARGPMPAATAIGLAAEIARGLAAAHERGLVHRDLKPENVFLLPGGGLKLLDFGLAKAMHPDEPATRGDSVTETTPFQIAGTVAYMSPEQAAGETLAGPSDQFSLGTTLFEMLEGRRPFDRGTIPETLTAILRDEPPPLSLTQLSPRRQRLLLRLLAKDPAKRWVSTADLARDLHELADESLAETVDLDTAPTRGVARADRPARVRSTLATVFVIAAVVGLAVAVVARRPPPKAAPAGTSSRPSVAIVSLQNLSGDAQSAWLSPALTEMLAAELSGGGARCAAGEVMTRLQSDLALPATARLSGETVARVLGTVGCRYLVTGSYLVLGEGATREVRVDLNLSRQGAGEPVTVASEKGPESQLFTLVQSAGKKVLGELQKDGMASAAQPGVPFPDDVEALRLFADAVARFRTSDFGAARAALELAVARRPAFPQAWSFLAEVLTRAGDEVHAAEAAEKSLALLAGVTGRDRLLVEGRAQELSGRREEAFATYTKLVALDPDDLEAGLLLARAAVRLGRSRDALATVARLHRLPAPTGSDPRIDMREWMAHDASGSSNDALAAARRSAGEAHRRGSRLAEVDARQSAAWSLTRLGRNEEAISELEIAVPLAVAAAGRSHEAACLDTWGVALMRLTRRKEAHEKLERALSIRREIGSWFGEAATLNNLGALAHAEADRPEALRRFREAAVVLKALGRQHAAATAISNVAAMVADMGDPRQALEIDEEAIALRRAVKDKAGLGTSLRNRGARLRRLGRLPEARAALDEALAIAKETGENEGEASALHDLALLASDANDAATARDLLTRAESLRKESPDLAAEAAMARAWIDLDAGETEKAEGEIRSLSDQPAPAEEGTDDDSGKRQLGVSLLRIEVALRRGRFEEAERSLRAVPRDGVDAETRLLRALQDARCAIARGRAPAARKSLEPLLQEREGHGLVLDALEIRLVLAEGLRGEERAAARRKVADEAERLGLARLALRATDPGTRRPPTL